MMIYRGIIGAQVFKLLYKIKFSTVLPNRDYHISKAFVHDVVDEDNSVFHNYLLKRFSHKIF